MKITVIPAAQRDIADFADQHDLEMVVTEQAMGAWQRRNNIKPFQARFRHAETTNGSILSSEFGSGHSIEDAIRDYAERISHKRLVIHATKPERREFDVPLLTYKP